MLTYHEVLLHIQHFTYINADFTCHAFKSVGCDHLENLFHVQIWRGRDLFSFVDALSGRYRLEAAGID